MGAYQGLIQQIRPVNKRIFVPFFADFVAISAHFAAAYDAVNGLEVVSLGASLSDTMLLQLSPSNFRTSDSTGHARPGNPIQGTFLNTLTKGDSLKNIDFIYSLQGVLPTTLTATVKTYTFTTGGVSAAPTTRAALTTAALPIVNLSAAGSYVSNNVSVSTAGYLAGEGSLLTLAINAVTPAGSTVNLLGAIFNFNNVD